MSVIIRWLRKKMNQARGQESTPKSINDLPPEVLEKILQKLDSGENSMLPYRRVNSTWKNIIDDHLEKTNLKGELVGCTKGFILGGNPNPIPIIRCPPAIMDHPGNPFPSSSLLVAQRWNRFERNEKTYHEIPLETFMSKFGTNLTTFVIHDTFLPVPALIHIIKPLSNLKSLKFTDTTLVLKLLDDLVSFPALPHLTTLELLTYCIYGGGEELQEHFCPKFVNAYAAQLTSLKLDIQCNHLVPLVEPHYIFTSYKNYRFTTDYGPFPKLQELKLYKPHGKFLRFCCTPPLKHLSIVDLWSIKEPEEVDVVNADVLMRFVDKFSNTLESLTLDVLWCHILDDACKEKAVDTNGILQTAAVIFPKLKKLTLSYPTNEVEAAVIKKTFLVKFPALQELHLFNYKWAAEEERYNYNTDPIVEFINLQNYRNVSTTLNRVSVWCVGDNRNLVLKNRLLYFCEILP